MKRQIIEKYLATLTAINEHMEMWIATTKKSLITGNLIMNY